MEIKLLQSVAEEIGVKVFHEYGVNPDSWGWKKQTFINLSTLSKKKILKLRSVFSANENIRGTRVVVKDIDTWLKALDSGAEGAHARTCRQFEPLLIRFVGQSPGYRIYERFEEMEDVYLCYYVEKIQYEPERLDRGTRYPAYVYMDIIYEMFGGKKERKIYFYNEDVRGRSTVTALADKGFYIETEEFRSAYLDQMKRFSIIVKQIGKQYLARGIATDEGMDGNPSGRDSSWYWRRVHNYKMEESGNLSRVLIDVFKEDEERDRERDVHVDHWFWTIQSNIQLIKQRGRKKDNEDEEEEELIEDLDVDPPEIEIPIHPFIGVFDLRRHLRLRIHVDFLSEYIYDSDISEKLILPKYLKDLVSMLIEYSGISFGDIVEGKGGGAVVLLCGPPGTGKTLTAEVYAEAEQKGLYSVQCSQLGTDPENLEDELLKIFTRAHRWGAVLLLDEADVYVRSRGSDLQQNAIVGVFLRVLEYQNNVLFLTTNRPEDVDDAVASRCVARLNYKIPSAEDQAKIWRVLADISKVDLSDEIIQQVVVDNPDLSGRDVKNLLKLACLISNSREIPISVKIVKFVRQFKPTQSNSAVASNEIEELGEITEEMKKRVLKRKFSRGK